MSNTSLGFISSLFARILNTHISSLLFSNFSFLCFTRSQKRASFFKTSCINCRHLSACQVANLNMTDTYKLINRNDTCFISGHAMVALSGALRQFFMVTSHSKTSRISNKSATSTAQHAVSGNRVHRVLLSICPHSQQLV